jgi:hypothetical protein
VEKNKARQQSPIGGEEHQINQKRKMDYPSSFLASIPSRLHFLNKVLVRHHRPVNPMYRISAP